MSADKAVEATPRFPAALQGESWEVLGGRGWMGGGGDGGRGGALINPFLTARCYSAVY